MTEPLINAALIYNLTKYLILITILILTITLIKILINKKKKYFINQYAPKIKSPCPLAILIILLTLILTVFTNSYNQQLYDGINPKEHTINAFYNAPKMVTSNNINRDWTGKILVYTRDDCPSCQIVKKDMYKAVSKHKNVYIVDTNVQELRVLLTKYPVKSVPSAYYVPYNDNLKNNEHIKELITLKSDKFNKKEFNNLLDLQKSKR